MVLSLRVCDNNVFYMYCAEICTHGHVYPKCVHRDNSIKIGCHLEHSHEDPAQADCPGPIHSRFSKDSFCAARMRELAIMRLVTSSLATCSYILMWLWLLRRCRRSRLSSSRLRPMREYLLLLRSRGYLYPQVIKYMSKAALFPPGGVCPLPGRLIVHPGLIYEAARGFSLLFAWKAMISSPV